MACKVTASSKPIASNIQMDDRTATISKLFHHVNNEQEDSFKSVKKFNECVVNTFHLETIIKIFNIVTRNRDFSELQTLVQKQKRFFETDLSISDTRGYILRASNGNAAAIKLLKLFGDIDDTYENLSALQLASALDSKTGIEQLIEAGAVQGIEDAVSSAIRQDDPELLQLLINTSPDLNLNLAFKRAVEHESIRCIKQLMKTQQMPPIPLPSSPAPEVDEKLDPLKPAGPDPSSTDPESLSPTNSTRPNMSRKQFYFGDSLHEAAKLGDAVAIKSFILERGLNVDCTDSQGRTALMLAIHQKQFCVVDILLELGANVNMRCRSKEWLTVLGYAASVGHIETAQKLLSRGAKVRAKCAKDLSILQTAISYNQLEMVKFLIKEGASVSSSSTSGITPLHTCAAVRGAEKIAQELINHGARVTFEVFSAAIGIDNAEVIEILLDNVDDGRAAFTLAARWQKRASLEVFLKRGYDADAALVHVITAPGSIDYSMVRDLAQRGATTNCAQGKALMLKYSDNPNLYKLQIRKLVEHGATIPERMIRNCGSDERMQELKKFLCERAGVPYSQHECHIL